MSYANDIGLLVCHNVGILLRTYIITSNLSNLATSQIGTRNQVIHA